MCAESMPGEESDVCCRHPPSRGCRGTDAARGKIRLTVVAELCLESGKPKIPSRSPRPIHARRRTDRGGMCAGWNWSRRMARLCGLAEKSRLDSVCALMPHMNFLRHRTSPTCRRSPNGRNAGNLPWIRRIEAWEATTAGTLSRWRSTA